MVASPRLLTESRSEEWEFARLTGRVLVASGRESSSGRPTRPRPATARGAALPPVQSFAPVLTRPRQYGGHSMSARLRTVLVRAPAPPASDREWRDFGFLRPVDHALAEREHAAFRAVLRRPGRR